MSLGELDRDLLIRLWPEERAVLGCMVNKSFAKFLGAGLKFNLFTNYFKLHAEVKAYGNTVRDQIAALSSQPVSATKPIAPATEAPADCSFSQTSGAHQSANQQWPGTSTPASSLALPSSVCLANAGAPANPQQLPTPHSLNPNAVPFLPGLLSVEVLPDAQQTLPSEFVEESDSMDTEYPGFNSTLLTLVPPRIGPVGLRIVGSLLKLRGFSITCPHLTTEACTMAPRNASLQQPGCRLCDKDSNCRASTAGLTAAHSCCDVICSAIAEIVQRGHGDRLYGLHLGIQYEGTYTFSLLQSLTKCKNLTTLNLGRMRFGPHGGKLVAQTVAQARALVSLEIGGNNIRDAGAGALAQALAGNSQLTILDLSSNNIQVSGISSLASTFSPNLTYLDLGGNTCGDEGLRYLARMFNQLPELKTLSLWANSISPRGATFLAESLQHTPKLHVLDLRSNNIGDLGVRGDGSDDTTLAEAVGQMKDLRVLDLGGNALRFKGFHALSNALNTPVMMGEQRMTSFESGRRQKGLDLLNLRSNDLGAGLRNNEANEEEFDSAWVRGLEAVDLTGNQLGVEGARWLSKALSMEVHWKLSHAHLSAVTCSLRILELRGNNIGCEGLSLLMKGLSGPTRGEGLMLEHLGLWGNDLRLEGISTFSTALSAGRLGGALKVLDLGSNAIGGEGADRLVESLVCCPQISVLSLWGNAIGSLGIKLIAEALMGCPCLKQLDVRGNMLEREGLINVLSILENHPHLLAHQQEEEPGERSAKAGPRARKSQHKVRGELTRRAKSLGVLV